MLGEVSFLFLLFNIEHYSDQISVSSGVPQVDHLSPTLFLIFINGVSLAMKNSNLQLFADDAKTFKTINSKSDTMLLQSDLNCFHKWCNTVIVWNLIIINVL